MTQIITKILFDPDNPLEVYMYALKASYLKDNIKKTIGIP
jgi:hypothetical protein